MRINKKICLWAVLIAALTVFANLSAEPAQAAEKIAVSSADDLRAMESNPSGSYYLTKDIVVPEGMTLFNSNNRFTGTFDGKGHKLKNYKLDISSNEYIVAALFTYTDGAKFKNLTMTGVDIRVSSGHEGARVAPLVANAVRSTFSNIKVSGSMQVKGANDSIEGSNGIALSGLAVDGEKYVKCQSSVNLTLDVVDLYSEQTVAGLAGGIWPTTMKDCTYSGKIDVKATVYGVEDSGLSVAGVTAGAEVLKNCKNSGTIKVNAEGYLKVAGIVNEITSPTFTCTGCKNSGNITLTTNASEMVVGGIVGSNDYVVPITKCVNTGKITIKDKANGMVCVGGIGGNVGAINQSYNKGAIKVTFGKNLGRIKFVGGLAGSVLDLRNSYNTGAVTLAGEGMVGGLAGHTEGFDERVIYNYSTGKVKGSKGAFAGNLIGEYSGPSGSNPVRMSYDCYYTQGGRAIGSSAVTWEEWTAKNKKVSSITSSNCPKLSSKYWKYSSELKRMILKNNPEK